MKKYIAFVFILFFVSSCISRSDKSNSDSNKKIDKVAAKEIIDTKFSFDKYIENFIESRDYYNNNSQTRSDVSIELRDSLMLFKGDTLYNLTLKFNDLGPTVEGIRSIGFKYSYLLPNYKFVEARFSGRIEISKIKELVEGSKYSVMGIFNGFTEDARAKGKLHMTPNVKYDGDIDLGVIPIEIISITKQGAAN